MMAGVQRTRPGERREAAPTPGMTREEAISTGQMWAGLVRTAPGMVSGWHHHGDHDTVFFVQSGAVRMEFGPGGREAIEAQPGDFVHVDRGIVHRELNPTEAESQVIVIRAGSGETVVNVDGPPSA